MTTRIIRHPAIAAGHDNEDNLQRLHKLGAECDGFKQYKGYIETTFSPFEDTELSGSRRRVRIGLPTASWSFPILTHEEFHFILNTFFPDDADDALVTIRTLDTEFYEWKNYNAIFDRPSYEFDGIEYLNVTFAFRELEYIPPA